MPPAARSHQGKGEKHALFTSLVFKTIRSFASHLLGYTITAYVLLVTLAAAYVVVIVVVAIIQEMQVDMTTASWMAYSKEFQKHTSKYYLEVCGSQREIPFKKQVCNVWGRYMQREPHIIERVKALARLLAEISNEFFERTTWGTLVFVFYIPILLIVRGDRL